MRRTPFAVAAVFMLLSLWSASPGVAHADDGRLHVVLVDGSEVQGELVEKVPGDHVTLKLATGEIRTIPWASIQSTNAITPPLPPASGFMSDPSGMTPYSFGAGIFSGSQDKNNVPWPKPDRAGSPFAGDHLYLGLASGIGTPTGYGGIVAAWDPTSYFELEAGIGLGGHFGYAIGGMARLELPLLRWMRTGLGVGFSENFLSASSRAEDGAYPNAPKVSRWFNLEFLSQDFALGKSAMLRFSSGFAFILNRSSYSSLCPPGSMSLSSKNYQYDCVLGQSLPVTPKVLASDTRPPFVPYFGLEFLWKFS